MDTKKQEESPKAAIRVNVPNPNFPDKSSQERVIGYVPADSDGSVAVIAGGDQVRITDPFGIPNQNVIVNPR